ncbi:MAG: pyruvate formate lyase-activating protein [Anaerolineae bacterium]|nr:pyruvate formate lyase-activating protein [Anaerolineales bacterium]MCQ3972661.1 pyruvate formate lyase-activating protein [Anaerolineae bacterium]
MKILAVDVGTGTQDILLFDSDKEVENCYKLVLPSPTVMLAQQIRAATQQGVGVVLSGVLMGGGPCAWAARDHAQAGYPLWVTPDAARTFDDDPARVEALGATIVGEDEAAAINGQAVHLTMGDFDYRAIAAAFARFGVDLDHDLDAIAIAVFDHGNAPPGVSDRLFRFEYIETRIQTRNSLTSFAFPAEHVPPMMTRLEATARTARAARPDLPVLLMDTAPAAVLGALEDPRVGQTRPAIVANIGNFHCLAFRLGPTNDDPAGGIEGVFEHHTGEITPAQLEGYLRRLAQGDLSHTEIFDSNGHGAVMFAHHAIPLEFLSITGPRRNFLRGSALNPYLATPFGDMMLAGSYGLIRAYTTVRPDWGEAIDQALQGQGGKSLW